MMLHCRDVVDLILAYLEGTLDPGERQAFESHIADCLNCWRFLQTYRETVALI
jgi:anti-sigma factor RsiW